MIPYATDESDLRLAANELDTARAMLRQAQSIADRRERVAIVRNAVDKLSLASRAIGVVVERRTPE